MQIAKIYSRMLPLAAAVLISVVAKAAESNAVPKTVRVMAIGNSFSRDAMMHLPMIVKASGNNIVMENAIILGGSLENHARGIAAWETNGPAHIAQCYGGKSLANMLKREPWDVVTIQQASPKSFKPDTFEPFAQTIIDFVHEHAPQAEIVVHQTWAYRDDHPMFTNGVFTIDDMYAGVVKAYDQLAEKHSLRQIPSGDAFQIARSFEGWGKFVPDPNFDWKTAEHPALPQNEKFSLHRAGYWIQDRKTKKHIFSRDTFHASSNGHYLLGCVWYEFLFNESVVGNTFVSPYVDEGATPVLQQIAHKAVEQKRAVNDKRAAALRGEWLTMPKTESFQ